MATHVNAQDFKRSRVTGIPDVYFPIVTPAVAALTLSILYLAAQYNLPFPWVYRYMCVIPVMLAAYQYGLRIGLISAALFSVAYLPELYWVWYWNGISLVTLERISFILFLTVLAYIVAEVAASERTQEVLSDAVRDGKALLARTSDFDEVIAFTLQEAEKLSGTETAMLLLRTPLSEQWELITRDEKVPLRPSDGSRDARQNLAEWLLEQASSVVLTDLARDDRFLMPAGNGTQLRSLVARPLRRRDRSLLGVLVLLNKKNGRSLTRNDLRALEELVTGSERALEQAGLYAQTDRALALRVKHLSAIQRTARQLNATLEPQEIVDHTVACAREITDGDAGLIYVNMAGLPTLKQCWGRSLRQSHIETVIGQTRGANRATLQPGGRSLLLPNAGARLLAPIRRENQTLGVILVESERSGAFEQATIQAVVSLTDHAMTALENARLFREIRREKNRVNLIIRSVADGLFTTDSLGRILTFNPAAEQLTGWTTDEAVGRTVCDVFGCMEDDHDTREPCLLQDAIREQKIIHDQKWIIRQRLGTKRVVSVSAAPLSKTDDQTNGIVVVFRDVTEQDELDRLQREFVAAFSHELRTPLTKISAIVEMLAEENPGSHQDTDYYDILMDQSRQLAEFTEKILDVSRLDGSHGTLQLRPIAISLLANDIVHEWKKSNTTHTITLSRPSTPLWVHADEGAVQTVLKNLIDNAIKYSPAGTEISVSIVQPTSDRVVVMVEDDGVGIAPEHQAKIFDRFYRVDGSDAQSVYGHGLGLYLSKTLVEAMNGQIWVESEPNAGSRFAFSLPRIKEGTDDSTAIGD